MSQDPNINRVSFEEIDELHALGIELHQDGQYVIIANVSNGSVEYLVGPQSSGTGVIPSLQDVTTVDNSTNRDIVINGTTYTGTFIGDVIDWSTAGKITTDRAIDAGGNIETPGDIKGRFLYGDGSFLVNLPMPTDFLPIDNPIFTGTIKGNNGIFNFGVSAMTFSSAETSLSDRELITGADDFFIKNSEGDRLLKLGFDSSHVFYKHVEGVYPDEDAHLSTKKYTDDEILKLSDIVLHRSGGTVNGDVTINDGFKLLLSSNSNTSFNKNYIYSDDNNREAALHVKGYTGVKLESEIIDDSDPDYSGLTFNNKNVITNDTTNTQMSASKMWVGTQVDYDNIPLSELKDTTLYIII